MAVSPQHASYFTLHGRIASACFILYTAWPHRLRRASCAIDSSIRARCRVVTVIATAMSVALVLSPYCPCHYYYYSCRRTWRKRAPTPCLYTFTLYFILSPQDLAKARANAVPADQILRLPPYAAKYSNYNEQGSPHPAHVIAYLLLAYLIA